MSELPATSGNLAVNIARADSRLLLNFELSAAETKTITWRPRRKVLIRDAFMRASARPAAGEFSKIQLSVKALDMTNKARIVGFDTDSTTAYFNLTKSSEVDMYVPADTEFELIIQASSNLETVTLSLSVEEIDDAPVSPGTEISSRGCGIMDFFRGECIHGINS